MSRRLPRMRRCPSCWTYTFSERCPLCGAETTSPAPPPFNPKEITTA